ncbi:MAG: TMEM175 family protein [Ginsengibacter sp.]
MLRKEVAKQLAKNQTFRLRGHEILRIEAFSDAVFAFAVTLLIVSLEVPKSFEELMVTMRGFFAFGVSFLILMMIWYEQNVFFRRYGMHDVKTVVLNCTLIFLVLFYVYPLKFLFTLIFSKQIYGAGNSPFHMSLEDTPKLMMIYGTGYILIYILFFFMYLHALDKKVELGLTSSETFDTKSTLYAKLLLISIGMLSVMTAFLLPTRYSGLSGMVYMLIGPAFTIFYSIRNRMKKKYGTNHAEIK